MGHKVQRLERVALGSLELGDLPVGHYRQLAPHEIASLSALVTGRKPGQPTKYEEVKDEVKEVFYSRLRETLVGQLRQGAKITVAAAPK